MYFQVAGVQIRKPFKDFMQVQFGKNHDENLQS